MDKEDYTRKAEELLEQPAYRTIDSDPTNKIKASLITKLRKIKKETRLDEGTYKIMYPTSCVPPKFYGLPKIHKTGTPLRPLGHLWGSQPLVGKSPHHVQSIRDFVNKAKKITLQQGLSYII